MNKPANHRNIDPIHPDLNLVKRAAEIIRGGGIVLYPTRCLYGFGVDAFDLDALNRLLVLKGRPENKPIPVLIRGENDIERLVAKTTPAARKLMASFWPGNVTLVAEAKKGLPLPLTLSTEKIGFRLPGHPVAAALVNAVKSPITGTSANLSGRPGCADIAELDSQLIAAADLVLDAGPLAGGSGSTVVDVSAPDIKILREGVISRKDIYEALASV